MTEQSEQRLEACPHCGCLQHDRDPSCEEWPNGRIHWHCGYSEGDDPEGSACEEHRMIRRAAPFVNAVAMIVKQDGGDPGKALAWLVDAASLTGSVSALSHFEEPADA